MKILSLNIRGFGGDTKIRSLRALLGRESVDFIAIRESSLVDNADSIVRSFWTHDEFGFYQSPAQGRSGGLLCIWKKSIFKAQNAFEGRGFLGVTGVWQSSNSSVTYLNVYGPHKNSARQQLWGDLLEVLSRSKWRGCLMGDFNVVHHQDERKGSHFYQWMLPRVAKPYEERA